MCCGPIHDHGCVVACPANHSEVLPESPISVSVFVSSPVLCPVVVETIQDAQN